MGCRKKELNSFRRKLGCWLHERWRAEFALQFSRWFGLATPWQGLCNRSERLHRGQEKDCFECLWEDSSWLTLAQVFPDVGRRLLQHAMKEWPFFLCEGLGPKCRSDIPVDVIVPFGGTERIIQLQAVVRSLLCQNFPPAQIVLAGQLEGLPEDCQWLSACRKIELPKSLMFNKSQAFNAGVRESKSDILLLHDADIVVPGSYLRDISRRMQGRWHGMRPLRFLFSLSQQDSTEFQKSGMVSSSAEVSEVMQNFPGGSIVVRREVYHTIGGFDEDFVGWGGEDIEFLDRLRTCRMYPGSFAPGIHLWHPSAVQKVTGHRNYDLMAAKLQVSVAERITALVGRRLG
jgi:hypothetical protein